MNIISDQGYRMDGRFYNELRHMKFNHHIVNNTHIIDLHQGLTIIRCMVDGPKEKRRRSENFQIKINNTNVAKQDKIVKSKNEEMEDVIKQIFKEIIIQEICVELKIDVLQDDGCVLPAIINLVSFAFCVSGIPILDICLAVEISKNKEYLLTDSIKLEEGRTNYIATYFWHRKTIGYLYFCGKLTVEEVESCNLITIGCMEQIYDFFTSVLKENIYFKNFIKD